VPKKAVARSKDIEDRRAKVTPSEAGPVADELVAGRGPPDRELDHRPVVGEMHRWPAQAENRGRDEKR
jgi:hypothetical protein